MVVVLDKTLDQLAMTNSVFWYVHVLRNGDGYFLRWAFAFEVNTKRKNGWSNRTWMNEVEEESN